MKKQILLPLLLSFLLLPGCGAETGAPPKGSSFPGSSSLFQPASSLSAPSESLTLKLCTVEGKQLTAVDKDGGPYSFSWELIPGETPLSPGMVVEVAFEGGVMETYPMQLIPQKVTVKEKGWDYLSLYRKALSDIWGEDTGLNGGTLVYFGFDFTEIATLSKWEKQLLAQSFSEGHGTTPLFGSITELMEEGYINEEHLYWEDGVHFTISKEEAKNGKVSFSIEKWKGGLAAIGYETTARCKEGIWEIEDPSCMWIS